MSSGMTIKFFHFKTQTSKRRKYNSNICVRHFKCVDVWTTYNFDPKLPKLDDCVVVEEEDDDDDNKKTSCGRDLIYIHTYYINLEINLKPNNNIICMALKSVWKNSYKSIL